MLLQPIIDLAEICHKHGVEKAVLSPGSRVAPLTLAFTRHPKINCQTLSDERSAAFVGMGMALNDDKPVVLACTSGSAAYNYAPAVSEAFYQQIPLIILTADRPSEWLDQMDGQTIKQKDIYGKHVKNSYELPIDYDNENTQWHINRIMNEAILEAQRFPKGPVHINIPLREPFYPEENETFQPSENIRIIKELEGSRLLSDEEIEELAKKIRSKKTIIIAGQRKKDIEFSNVINRFIETHNIPVFGDILSNIHDSEEVIKLQDSFLLNDKIRNEESLKPELIITFGKSVISKQLKLYLRSVKNLKHWHIQTDGYCPDTFQCLTKIIRTDAFTFFNQMLQISDNLGNEELQNNWKSIDLQCKMTQNEFFASQKNANEWGEFSSLQSIIQSLPDTALLHLSNSMSIRYANYIGLEPDAPELFCNRGTSGIDGSNSTAVGISLATPERMNIIITGDMAFFYDRNAFWHNYSMANLRVIVMNNHAGGIFRLIKGPSQQEELEEYFETRQNLNAQNTAMDFSMDYSYAYDENSLNKALIDFFKPSENCKLLEVNSDSSINAKIFDLFKGCIKNSDFKLTSEKK
ncbi:2-succinyl-5-enolpyruvyl-6-hydroxy-3-cyclohexene-1-carboxylic-acid synthase [Aureibacter tunicatorum]|uniref:2-succinyl-5-enolpyruvyl-6-hydroxy-3-cyclohexene-1-carboxylate synthase n=1 Tax=Aureibacter tunicatorum TaxID=866807 RepID=A0AAE4BT34_9BACT|nr:2-succinyl-5-enolpyruvyl-6-hydroxy-3-cyclohexene-1-carboxylic-acid synthase [Aureibacter tunicatorum]MDR6239443.1 2-succinyl-5-enolpyruvyl-6-hydroxy-3-cyclohexene-1-carboxylate synthase [Aureibacter tunicatorum]BDD04634.1 2-succinyl-5-enolpyruvyl-6-hydroxy-3-cyclohexene- 1-carboxylate synthase [Aureibacter tunicatorum]